MFVVRMHCAWEGWGSHRLQREGESSASGFNDASIPGNSLMQSADACCRYLLGLKGHLACTEMLVHHPECFLDLSLGDERLGFTNLRDVKRK